MSALPSLPASGQLGLFEAPAAPQTKLCPSCNRERKITLFAWVNPRTKLEREEVCNTCRINGGGFGKRTGKQQQRSQALLDAPLPNALITQPAPLWVVKKGDTVNLVINDERTGTTLFLEATVVGVKPTAWLAKCYGRVRAALVGQGWQIGEIRASIAAPLLEKATRGGR